MLTKKKYKSYFEEGLLISIIEQYLVQLCKDFIYFIKTLLISNLT